MSKHKHNRERERAHEHALHEAERIRLLNTVPVSTENQAEPPETADSQIHNKKENPVRFRESFKPSSFTDYCLALFTGLLVVVAILQMVITQRQLDVMRKDQRPWIKLTFDNLITTVGSPVGGNLHTVDNGKTPAKNIEGKFAIEKVKNGEQPRLDYGHAWTKFTVGSIFPNDPQAQAVNMQQIVFTPSGPSYQAVVLSQPDFDDFIQGRIFFVAYGRVSYSDFFRVQHWTTYCIFFPAPESPAVVAPKQYTARDCTDYNNVDDN